MKRIILPEEKLDSLANALCEHLFEGRYFSNGIIKGEELKNCTDFPQINKFVLFQLFQILNQQFQKLKHPYFDYESQEVLTSVNVLKNQLSRNIRITREDFKPLLKKAIFNNLKLILDPVETLGNFFFHTQDKISLETYEKYTPFFSDFDFAVSSILRYHQKNGMQTVEKDIFFVKLHRVIAIFNNSSDKNIEFYRNELMMRLTGRTIDDLVGETQREAEFLKQEWFRREDEKRRLEAEEEERKRVEKENEAFAKAQEADRLRMEEEARKKEELERIKAEAERLRTEEEEKRRKEQSFFDTIEAKNAYFDISDDEHTTRIENDEVIKIGADIPLLSNNQAEFDTVKAEINNTNNIVIDKPSIDTPAIETPEVEAPKVDSPAIEIPEVEAPKVDSPVIEIPEVEAPKVENNPQSDLPEINLPALELEDSGIVLPETSEVVSNPISVVHEEPEVVKEEPPVMSIFEKYFKKSELSTTEQPNVLDNIKETKEEPKTVLENFAAESPSHLINTINAEQKIRMDTIPIHQQYMYVQRVFMGNNVRFRIIIDKVNNATSREEVEEIIDKYILSNNDIKTSDTAVEEFVQLLRSRFVF